MPRTSFAALSLSALLMGCSFIGSPGGPEGPGPSPLVSRPGDATSQVSTPDASPEPESRPEFIGWSSGVHPQHLPHSWRPGCPVPAEDLRLLTLTHWGFDGRVHTGELVVHEDQESRVISAMQTLFEVQFPIEKMQLVDVYEGDDDRSAEANNTSAFNCRPVSGQPGVWSQHAYGRAIDINPVQNPFLAASGNVVPPSGAAYADRSQDHPGMIQPGDEVVEAFATVGWQWGGNWTSSKDYQHFSATGR